MVWPISDVNNTNTSSGSTAGQPAAARLDIRDLITKFNEMRGHVSAFIQGLLDDTDEVTARNTLNVPSKSGSGATGTWPIGISGTATTATNLAGGGAGQVPYQSASGTTAMLAAGTSGQVLQSNGTSAPTWVTPSGITVNSSVATTSGTAITISTSIPSTAKRVKLLLSGVSTNGSSQVIIQLGNGSFVTTGYISSVSSGNFGLIATDGFATSQSPASTIITTGAYIFDLFGGDKWIASGSFDRGASGIVQVCAGEIDLSSALDRIRITTSGGTDTFDAGSVVLTWE